MKKTLKGVLSIILCTALVLTSLTLVFASDTVTPVISISGIEYNPLVSDEDVVFNLADFDWNIPFTKPFTDHITSAFSKENLETYKTEDGSFDFLAMAMGILNVVNVTNDVLDLVAQISEAFGEVSEKIDFSDLSSIDIEQVKELAQTAADGIKAKYDNAVKSLNAIKLNPDGTVKDSSVTAGEYDCSVYDINDSFKDLRISPVTAGIAENNGEENTYIFLYDWRLSPVDNAEKLNAFIKAVKSASGEDKVSIVSEGYGSTVAVTYLSQYESDAARDVKSFTTVSSAFEGTSLFGDIYTGKLIDVFSDSTVTQKTSAMVRYLNDLSDNPVTAFATWLSNYILSRDTQNQDLMILFQRHIENLLKVFAYGYGKDIFANSKGLWALVPADSFDEAVAFTFGGEENADAGLLADIKNFNAIQKNADDIIKKAQDNGIFVNVVAMWDIQIFPIGVTSDVQSDGIIDTAYASFGAECVALNEVKTAMKTVQSEDTDHDHLSDNFDLMTPDYAIAGLCHYIDASVCALPENTWFIRNMKYGTFNPQSNTFDFLMWLINSEEQRTVWDNGNYRQFVDLNRYIGTGGTLETVDEKAVQGKYLLGDINLDGKITVADSVLCDKIVSGEVSYEDGATALKNADINGDGTVDEADSDLILVVSSGLEEDMTSGFDYAKPEKDESLKDAQGSFKAEVSYDPYTNEATVTVYIENPADVTTGNIVLTLDTQSFEMEDCEFGEVEEGFIAAGSPDIEPEYITCGYKIKTGSADEVMLFSMKYKINGVIDEDFDVELYATEMSENGYKVNSDTAEKTIKKEFFGMVGDASGDRLFNTVDVRKLLRVAAKLDTVDESVVPFVDADKDGKITVHDARALLKVCAKLDSLSVLFKDIKAETTVIG